MKRSQLKASLFPITTSLVALSLYQAVIRPWMNRWGSDDKEHEGPWPGDELIGQPQFTSTRATTVHAPAATVWAWLVQVGQDRAGTYSYTLFENFFGVDTVNVEWLVPRFQQIEVGDRIRMPTPARFGGRGPDVVLALEPERALVLGHSKRAQLEPAARSTWTFLVLPLTEDSSRLLIRARMIPQLTVWERLIGLATEPIHFFMERQMLLGIKARAEESYRRPRPGTKRLANPPLTSR